MTLQQQWQEAVGRKKSILCAGIDPPEAEMGHKNALEKNQEKLTWAINYVHAVAPYCAAVKPNVQFWKNKAGEDGPGVDGMTALSEIRRIANALDLLVIDDSKLADIGATNDAGVFYAAKRLVDAVTYSPFPGNMKEFAGQCEKRGIGSIAMCLMSNPEYKTKKNSWEDVSDDAQAYRELEVKVLDGVPHVRRFVQLARDAARFGIDGIVVGAPSKDNHITEEELQKARFYSRDDTIALVPGIGTQGGEAALPLKYFGDNCIVNVGGGLMFPKGKSQADAARDYRDMLNTLRGV